MCASSGADALDLLYNTIPPLLSQRNFGEIDLFLATLEMSQVDTSTIYSLVHLLSKYRQQLANWDKLYLQSREEFARRGKPADEITDLFDRYREIEAKELFNPDAPPYKSPEQKLEDKLTSKIVWAQEIGDRDLEDLLTYYQASRQQYKEREEKFRHLRQLLGNEELRQRCIKSLREMANTLEEGTGNWPGIYYCDLPENPLLKKTYIDSIEVCISYPWPG